MTCASDPPQPRLGTDEQSAITPLPGNLDLALNARTSVMIGPLSAIAGDVGASGISGTVIFDISSTQDASRNVLANTVRIRAGAAVGHAFGNDLIVDGTSASQNLGLDPATLPQVPGAAAADPGTTDLSVAANQRKQVCAGHYGAVSLAPNATLNLNGGVYHMTRLTLAEGAKLMPSEPVVIVVAGNVNTGTGAFIGPFPTVVDPMSAEDIRIEAGGAVTLGASSETRAHILAPDGKLSTGTDAKLVGGAWANIIRIGTSNIVQGQDSFRAQAPAMPPACNDDDACTVDQCVGGGTALGFCRNTPAVVDDGNTCTADSCDPDTGVQHAPLPDGTACADLGVCEAGECASPGSRFSFDLVQGQATTAQCAAWLTFLDDLTAPSYRSVTLRGSNDPAGFTCRDPALATEICDAMHDIRLISVFCDGHVWNVGPCGGAEISIDKPICQCGFGNTARPCIGNGNWGGLDSETCDAPSQSITVICQ